MIDEAAVRGWSARLNRPLMAGVVVLLVYVGLAQLMAPGGSLGTDTGAKVATLEVMSDRGSWRPEVGYWAAQWDPEGTMHPMYQSAPVDGDFVVVTTLPMLLLAHPLYDLGGYRLALLLPMLGAVGAAFAGRALATRLSGPRAGWTAFWLVGLASPMTVYALDFWEHTVGVTLVLWAGVHALDAARGLGRAWGPPLAGILLGAAATLRTEALLAALIIIGGAGIGALVRTRRLRAPLGLGITAVLGFAGPWLANAALEGAVGGISRTERAQGAAATGGGSELAERVDEGITTTVAATASESSSARMLGVVIVVLVVLGLRFALRRDERRAKVLGAGACLLLLLLAADGLAFVPGAWVALPAAGAGLLALGARGAERWVAAAALVGYPLTWAFQYLGGALPQWGGRYTLASSVALAICGICVASRAGRAGLAAVLLPCVVVTVLGVAFLGERSRHFERTFDVLVERPEDVVVAQNRFFVREGMAAYTERRWLALRPGVTLVDVAALVDRASLDDFALISNDDAAAIAVGEFELTETTPVPDLGGGTLYIHSYALGS